MEATSRVDDILHSLADPIGYMRRIAGSFVEFQFDKAASIMRVGVTGRGIVPNSERLARLLDADEKDSQNLDTLGGEQDLTVRRRYSSVRTGPSPTVNALQAAGATSLRAIAKGLNAQGIPTARGRGPRSRWRGFWNGFDLKRLIWGAGTV
jgi:hypothetical protein